MSIISKKTENGICRYCVVEIMLSEKLLATYSLLAFIKDNERNENRKSLVGLFEPIVMQTINWMLQDNGFRPLMGKDYTEIKVGVKKFFDLDMPIEVIDTVMDNIYEEDKDRLFTLNWDHSYIIKQGFAVSLDKEYNNQKDRVLKLERHYNTYCKRQSVTPDFQELISFVQDQKNRVFDSDDTVVDQQSYHISKYVRECIRRKDYYYEIICSIYLGGIISSYYKFQINEKVVDTELLWDTNFYISLCNLNTKEAYETCSQLFDMARAMGFRFSILQRTIEQIRILISNKAKDFDNKDYISSWDESDILSACSRENISKSELLLVKDNLLDDLCHRGVNIIYDANIREIIDAAEKSSDLCKLAKIRGSRESAMNDIIAQMYVEKKRKGKQIAEFNDVNCWFLNNSFSVNKKELQIPVWQRISISAPDLLLLLWFANPSMMGGKNDSLLAVSSLSANIFKFRSEKMPPSKVVEEIQNKVAKLQLSNQVSQHAIAKLCIRMSEGCIEEKEAERLIMMPTAEFVDYLEKLRDSDDAYMIVSAENDDLRGRNRDLTINLIEEKTVGVIKEMRFWTVIYLIGAIALYLVYWFFIYRNHLLPLSLDFVVQVLYWMISCIGINFISHNYLLMGFVSFINPTKINEKVREKIRKEMEG